MLPRAWRQVRVSTCRSEPICSPLLSDPEAPASFRRAAPLGETSELPEVEHGAGEARRVVRYPAFDRPITFQYYINYRYNGEDSMWLFFSDS